MQILKLDEFTSERQATRKEYPSREVNGLDHKHLEMQAIREPSQDGFGNQRLGKHDCDEGPGDPKFIQYFQG